MEFHFLEMPKLITDWKQKKLDPWNDVLARWLLLLGIVDHRNGKVYEDIYKELEAIAMKDETLKQAFQGRDILSASQEEVLAYEARLKQVLDAEAAKREAELREQEALERGRKEGKEEGRKEGRKEGQEEGREEGTVQGLINSVISFLDVMYPDQITNDVQSKLETIKNSANLKALQKELYKAKSWNDIEALINNYVNK